MVRQGTHTKRRSKVRGIRWALKRRWRWFKKLSKPKKVLVLGGPILAFLIVTPIFTYMYYYNDIANEERLMNSSNTGVVLLDKNKEAFYRLGKAEHRKLIPLTEISDITEHALVASEDREFYQHPGFSFFSIIKAIYANVAAGDATAYGGSTLTQQLAKNTLLTTNQTILRKYQELTIAMAIEQRYSKDEILDMYLNSVYFGNNSFGIEDAAQNYYGKKASELTLAEASMLIGVLPAPSAYSPVDGDPKLAKERQNTVLSRMVGNKYITAAEKDAALKVELKYAEPKTTIDNRAPHFTEMVLQELYDKYGEEKVKRSGYQVETTLDLHLQDAAIKSVDQAIGHIRANGGSNASLVAIDPLNGEIRALLGTADYNDEKFGKVNMALTKRQPGSSFKPIYYADGLASGTITPVTILKDEKIDIDGYSPQNADRRFRGNVTTRQALNWSLNIPSIKVMQQVTVSKSVEAAKKLGITTMKEANNYGLSLALGSAEVPLIEMTNAYATFANEGKHNSYTTIRSIEDKYTQTIFVGKHDTTQGISAQGAYLISDILSDNPTRSVIFGSSLSVYGSDGKLKNVAVKTGTTDDARDAWTIGYTPNLAVGVWVGNNDNAEMYSGGSDMAGPIWRNVMKAAIGESNPAFTRPSGITEETVCTVVGRFTDVFLSSNVPEGCGSAPTPTPTKQSEPEPTVTVEPSPSIDPTPTPSISPTPSPSPSPSPTVSPVVTVPPSP